MMADSEQEIVPPRQLFLSETPREAKAIEKR
jgi:hypothetical protein